MKPSQDPTAVLRFRLASGSMLFGLLIAGFAIARLLGGPRGFVGAATAVVGTLTAPAVVLAALSMAESVPAPVARRRLGVAWTCIGLALLIQVAVASLEQGS